MTIKENFIEFLRANNILIQNQQYDNYSKNKGILDTLSYMILAFESNDLIKELRINNKGIEFVRRSFETPNSPFNSLNYFMPFGSLKKLTKNKKMFKESLERLRISLL